MRIVKQEEFDSFICTADKCTDNCCGGWQIEIDDETLKDLRDYEGPLKGAIEKAVDFENSCIRMNEKGRCELLNEKGLCRLVLEKGEGFISHICHTYPRHVEEYDGIREWSISLSCPEAAKTFILRRESQEYIISDNDDPEPLEEDFEDFDILLFTKLEDSRDVIFDILNDRKKTVRERMKLILMLAFCLQMALDEDRLFDMDDIIDDVRKDPAAIYGYTEKGFGVFEDEGALDSYITDNAPVLYRLERLKNDWDDVLAVTADFPGSCDDIPRAYSDAVSELGKESREIILENILHTFIYTYYLGAVYDDEIYAKISMSVFCTLLIDHIYVCRRYAGKDGSGTDTYINTAYRFAKEIEHSDINLGIMEEVSAGLFTE
ncbi:MAG: flagellin lysine-N-methylase [Lachnospiraceae bacterium]|nr:flagellin lysine-N-methylase [Lachnospiraceae bacterium]